MASKFRETFVHDGRYAKAGRNFLKLDASDNMLIHDIGSSSSKRYIVCALADFRKKAEKFHKIKIVGQDEVDRFTKELEKFQEAELKCDSHNSEEMKKHNNQASLFQNDN